jgi:hypothetical protein
MLLVVGSGPGSGVDVTGSRRDPARPGRLDDHDPGGVDRPITRIMGVAVPRPPRVVESAGPADVDREAHTGPEPVGTVCIPDRLVVWRPPDRRSVGVAPVGRPPGRVTARPVAVPGIPEHVPARGPRGIGPGPGRPDGAMSDHRRVDGNGRRDTSLRTHRSEQRRVMASVGESDVEAVEHVSGSSLTPRGEVEGGLRHPFGRSRPQSGEEGDGKRRRHEATGRGQVGHGRRSSLGETALHTLHMHEKCQGFRHGNKGTRFFPSRDG